MPIVGCTELKIGTSVATLLELHFRGIEAPDDWTYAGYSISRLAGTGQSKSFGFPNASWRWQVLDQESLDKLLAFFSADSDASVEVTISTYTDRGARQETADYTAYMQRPVDGEGKSLFPNSGGRVMQNVTVLFTHLEAA
jgi:hypothetical protein